MVIEYPIKTEKGMEELVSVYFYDVDELQYIPFIWIISLIHVIHRCGPFQCCGALC